jgi:CheY-like chemotaxis protein
MDTLEVLPRPRILLVDDDAEQLKICSEIIRMRGFSVLAANGAVEAISMMAQKPKGRIDLAVLDYNMPVMNGCALAEQLRSICPELKTILHSGATDIPRSEMTSVDVLIHKGAGMGQLLAQIAEFAQAGMPPSARLAVEAQ